MTGAAQLTAEDIRRCLSQDDLRDWIERQRWYASKSRSVNVVEILASVTLRDEPPLLLALVQTRFATGTHELYQLPLALQANGRPPSESIAGAGEWAVYDALAEPDQMRDVLRRIYAGEQIDTRDGRFGFYPAGDGDAAVGAAERARPMGVEQSNSSLVFDDRVVLKVFRKLEPGVNPELELLSFLARRGFANIAPLQGWYEYDGLALAATLGIAQSYLPQAIGGWELALEEIAGAPARFVERLRALGAVTAEMHTALASDAGDPAFSPEQPSQEALALLTATVDEDIERIFARLPDDPRLDPIVGRGQDIRELLQARAQIGVGGRTIRTHGDYHLGQTLHTPQGWVIIDFEGEPARPLPERRQKRSPLRDVASMLRSFSYAAASLPLLTGQTAPPTFEQGARDSFLGQYLATVDRTLLPAGEAAIMNLLSIFELEKAIYELRYELDHRPDWIPIPVAAIRRLLESM